MLDMQYGCLILTPCDTRVTFLVQTQQTSYIKSEYPRGSQYSLNQSLQSPSSIATDSATRPVNRSKMMPTFEPLEQKPRYCRDSPRAVLIHCRAHRFPTVTVRRSKYGIDKESLQTPLFSRNIFRSFFFASIAERRLHDGSRYLANQNGQLGGTRIDTMRMGL